MSSPFSSEDLADIRDGARRMVERTRAHEDDLNQLVETAEVIAFTGNAPIPTPLEPWFVAVVLKPSSPDVVLAAVQDAASR